MNTLQRNAEMIVNRLCEAGHQALFAGGCVRDMVMGIPPDDYDIATSALPAQVVKLFSRTLEVGARFGVIIVLVGKQQFEVATFRTETSYTDGRRPDSVEFSTPEEDVKRRDFTINGLLYDPLRKEVIDYVGGRDDIQRKIIRTIGEPRERFKEDRLRMLRAIRFAARLEFNIDPHTFDAIREMAAAILDVAPERIATEITKMFTGSHPDAALQLMRESGLLKHVLPEVDRLTGVEQPHQFHPEGDVFEHTKLMLGMLDKPDDVLAFSVLLHDIGKPSTYSVSDRIRFHNHDITGADMADEVLRKLRFSNEKRRKVVDIIRNHMRLMHAPKMRDGKLKKLLQRETLDAELELHRLDCLASHGGLDVYDFLVQKRMEIPPEEIKPEPLITGKDLIDAGYTPGPVFSDILSRVEEMQLEKELTTKADALEWVKKNYALQ